MKISRNEERLCQEKREYNIKDGRTAGRKEGKNMTSRMEGRRKQNKKWHHRRLKGRKEKKMISRNEGGWYYGRKKGM